MPHRFAPKKSLGQHFLHDPNMIRKIAGAVRAPEGTPVVEIGPGTGALTEELLKTHPSLTALEIDERAVAQLRQQHPALDVRHADVLEADWAALAREKGGPLYVVGNLPYNLTSPILFGLLAARKYIKEAVLMMQKEVAERFVAEPRTKAYGILSVLVQHHTHPRLLFSVSRHVFYPKPDVTSAVLRLVFKEEDELPEVDPEWLREVVRAAFNQRRKMLRNSLQALEGHPRLRAGGVALPEAWGRKRAEALTPAAFAELARHLATSDMNGQDAK